MKALFIDRDGTLIVEPPVTEQVNTLEELEFVPGVICALKEISKLGYKLVLATNQDGLGTESYPQADFDKVQAKFLKTLANEGVVFDDILIDNHYVHDNSPMRKPGIGMFCGYLDGSCDLAESYVIGDRLTDVQLAKNLGAKAIWYNEGEPNCDCALITNSWEGIAQFLRAESRCVSITRNTKETQISITVDPDGKIPTQISTGLNFFDHMLDQIAHHSGVSLDIKATGDLNVDEHHTMEDVGIALGEAIKECLGDKRGIGRYGFALPMDECRAMVLMDLGGRIDYSWEVEFSREYIGDTPTEMFKHFFKSLSESLKCNLHIVAKGENNHHLAEAVFKAFARALKQAVKRDLSDDSIPTSKGQLW